MLEFKIKQNEHVNKMKLNKRFSIIKKWSYIKGNVA